MTAVIFEIIDGLVPALHIKTPDKSAMINISEIGMLVSYKARKLLITPETWTNDHLAINIKGRIRGEEHIHSIAFDMPYHKACEFVQKYVDFQKNRELKRKLNV